MLRFDLVRGELRSCDSPSITLCISDSHRPQAAGELSIEKANTPSALRGHTHIFIQSTLAKAYPLLIFSNAEKFPSITYFIHSHSEDILMRRALL